MSSKKKKIMVYVIVISLLLIAGIWSATRSLPYPTPAGKFKVGTVIMDMEDSSRAEWALPENEQNRKFVVRMWYPASLTGKEALLPIMEKPYAKGMSKMYGFPTGKELPSHSHINAPVYQGAEKFPIVIFTHGGGSFMTQNLSSMEELASQGFVVMSLSFPYESVATVFADNSVVYMKNLKGFKERMSVMVKDKDFASQFAKYTEEMKNPDPEKAKASSIALGEKYLQLFPEMNTWLNTRIDDISYLINNLGDISLQQHKLSDIAETDNIGLFGHSFGALTTLKFLMTNEVPSVKCGIALDAPYFIMDPASDISLKAPVLFISSDYQKIAGNKIRLNGINGFLKNYTDKTLHEANVKGSAHYNFSDMNYLPRFMKLTPMLGSIPQKEAAEIMTHYLNIYFRGHLKGEDLNKLNNSINSRVSFREIDKVN